MASSHFLQLTRQWRQTPGGAPVEDPRFVPVKPDVIDLSESEPTPLRRRTQAIKPEPAVKTEVKSETGIKREVKTEPGIKREVKTEVKREVKPEPSVKREVKSEPAFKFEPPTPVTKRTRATPSSGAASSSSSSAPTRAPTSRPLYASSSSSSPPTASSSTLAEDDEGEESELVVPETTYTFTRKLRAPQVLQPDVEPRYACKVDFLRMLYRSLDDAFRCYVAMFNQTTYPMDTLTNNFTNSVSAKATLTSLQKDATNYFSVPQISVPFVNDSNEVETKLFDPTELSLPYLTVDVLKAIRFVSNLEFGVLTTRPEAVALLVYAHVSFFLDIWTYLAYLTDDHAPPNNPVVQVHRALHALPKYAVASQFYGSMTGALATDAGIGKIKGALRTLTTDEDGPLLPIWQRFYDVREGFFADFYPLFTSIIHNVHCAGKYAVGTDPLDEHYRALDAATQVVAQSEYVVRMSALSSMFLEFCLPKLIPLPKAGVEKLTVQIKLKLEEIAKAVNAALSTVETPNMVNISPKISNTLLAYAPDKHIQTIQQWWRFDLKEPYILRREIAGIIYNQGISVFQYAFVGTTPIVRLSEDALTRIINTAWDTIEKMVR